MNDKKPLTTLAGLASLTRPRFAPGLLLEDEDLTAGVEYTRNMMRLMFRSLFGCGVICGLEVQAEPTCNGRKLSVTVERGIALDCIGNPIEIQATQTIVYDLDCKDLPDTVWVTVCYHEKCCRPKDIACTPDSDHQLVHTRVQQGFEIRLYDDQPACACSCEPPAAPEPAKDDSSCCAETTAKPDKQVGADADLLEKGTGSDPCACYADHMRGICTCDCGCTCVVLGKISTRNSNEDGAYKVDRSVRRFVRPMLAGQLECKKTERSIQDADSHQSKFD